MGPIPHARERALITPTGRRAGPILAAAEEPKTPAQRRQALTWAQRLKRVFNIDVLTCEHCGAPARIVA